MLVSLRERNIAIMRGCAMGAMALRPLEVVQLDVEVGRHLALDRLNGEAGGGAGDQLGDGLARHLDGDGLPVERRPGRQAQKRALELPDVALDVRGDVERHLVREDHPSRAPPCA